jgi:hypothetical protein
MDLEPHELGRDLGVALVVSLRPAILDRNGAALDPTEFAQPLLRAAINHHAKEGLHRGIVRVALPPKGQPRMRWLTRSEAAKLLWVCWRAREVQTVHGGPCKGKKIERDKRFNPRRALCSSRSTPRERACGLSGSTLHASRYSHSARTRSPTLPWIWNCSFDRKSTGAYNAEARFAVLPAMKL